MKKISEKEFDKEIEKGVVLVDFFATWCGPCRMMAVILEEIERELGQKVKIITVCLRKVCINAKYKILLTTVNKSPCFVLTLGGHNYHESFIF